MKNNLSFTVLLMLILSSCTTPKYLPSSEHIDVNVYGSYIEVVQKSASSIDGELIAIDSTNIIVLENGKNVCVTIPISDVEHFSLKYAKSKNYGWTIPAYTLATGGHGFLSIYTAPINLLVTISVTASGYNAFTYSDEDMTYDQLNMFARFPQGIPPDIVLINRLIIIQ